DEEITYTSLAPVLTETTTFHTISLPSYCKTSDYRGAFTDARGSSITLDAYEMGKYLVTNRLYNLVSGESLGGLSSDPGWPICSISYYHAVVFCNKLSIALGFKPCYSFGSHTVDEAYSWGYWAVNGRDMNLDNAFKDLKCDFGANGFRLPTELEWECCARGADETKWEWKNCYAAKTDAVWHYYYKNGDDECKKSEKGTDYLNSLSSSQKDTIYYVDNWLDLVCSFKRDDAYDVGLFKPTSTGQYDMSGLLWEWCWDTYQDIKSGSSIYGKVNYSNGKVQGNIKTSSYDAVRANRVIKGGYYHDSEPRNFMVFYRNNVTPVANDARYTDWGQAGFRLCRTIESEE
ncbi:MAG: formylglycine-generating enzyme family protein, partial [Treponema sp.]|nr:formylglycine-generating enzyme family protein [Treponema sp.]